MTDREMIELAAKAAGIKVLRSRLEDKACRDMLVSDSVRNPDQDAGPWNPRDDSGDALRLAVRLRIKFRYNETLRQGLAWTGGMDDIEARADIDECGQDENECARLAILRCAAEVGRRMT